MTENEPTHDQTRQVLILQPEAMVAQYKLIRKLGVGGMGEVFLAEDTILHRQVALKFLSPNLAADTVFRERFMREARSAAGLNHPNIVTVYEVAEFEERVFISLEFIEGTSLKDMIDSGSLDISQSFKLAKQICSGLKAAHKAKLIHRDIKPDNILIGKSGRVRILDFGLAKAEGDANLTSAGMTMGTVNYMSPEQGKGEEPDNRSDIFSLGIVFYEMFTGCLPFRGGNMPATIYAIVNDQPPPLSEYSDKMPSGLQTVIDKSLAKEPDKRFQKIDDLENDLIALFESVSQPAIPVSAEIAAQKPATKSLAVLYLKNIGPSNDEYLSYGITEDLIVDLTRLGSFRVSSMRAIMKYKESDADLEEIAAGLKVDLILDGSIMKMGETIRVSTQMTDVATGENLWAKRWEEPAANLPHIKQALAEGIMKALNLGQSDFIKAQVGQPETSNAGAYENYLKAKYTFERKQEKSDVDIALGLYSLALKEEPTLIAARAGIAEIMIFNGDFVSAKIELESALKDARKLKATAEQGDILKLLAGLYVRQSDWPMAQQCADEALQIIKEMGDLTGEAEVLGILISILQPQAKFDEVIIHFDRVLEISRQLDDQEKIAESLKNMGVAYSRKGDYDRALDLYEECLELSQKVENLSLQASCYANMGNLFYFRGKYDDAYEQYKIAFEMAEKIGDNALSARQSLNMGLIDLQTGKFAEGLESLEKAATIFESLGDRGNYALAMVNHSQAKLTLGDSAGAIESARIGLKIAEEIKNPLIKSDALIQLGAACFFDRKIEDAVVYYQQALDIAEEAKMNRNVAHIHLALVNICYYCKNYDKCKNHAKKALSIAKEIGEKTALIMSNAGLAAIDACEGLFSTGLRQLEEAYRGIRRIGNNQMKIHLQALLGEVLMKHGKSDKDIADGTEMLRKALTTAEENNYMPETKLIKEILENGQTTL